MNPKQQAMLDQALAVIKSDAESPDRLNVHKVEINDQATTTEEVKVLLYTNEGDWTICIEANGLTTITACPTRYHALDGDYLDHILVHLAED